jgi:hypothetical protein
MSGGMLYVPLMGTVSNYILQHNPSLPIKVRLDGNKAYISSTSDVSNVSLIGIK